MDGRNLRGLFPSYDNLADFYSAIHMSAPDLGPTGSLDLNSGQGDDGLSNPLLLGLGRGVRAHLHRGGLGYGGDAYLLDPRRTPRYLLPRRRSSGVAPSLSHGLAGSQSARLRRGHPFLPSRVGGAGRLVGSQSARAGIVGSQSARPGRGRPFLPPEVGGADRLQLKRMMKSWGGLAAGSTSAANNFASNFEDAPDLIGTGVVDAQDNNEGYDESTPDENALHEIHNESSCSSPDDGTPRSPADDTRTSPDEKLPSSHSSTCHIDSGQQSHPRNMENEIDGLDSKIITMMSCLSSSKNMSEGWYNDPEGIELLWEKLVHVESCRDFTKEMLKERIEKFKRMVKDYHGNLRPSLPKQRTMLYLFGGVGGQYYESVPETPLRTALVSEEPEAPSTKRARSESVDMAMYLSHPDAASMLFSSRFSMDDCTSRAQRLFQDHQDDRRILYSALSLLRQNIEIRQSFMTLEESYARGYIEHELKNSGML